MRKTFTILFLLTSILWQSIAMAGQGMVYDHAEGLAHAVLHLEKDGHHHHDDGTYHEDSSDQSSQHIQADDCLSVTELLPPVFCPALPQLGLPAPAKGLDCAPAAPFLEGPMRPPRLTA